MKLINICSCRKVILRPNKYIILKKVLKLKKKIIKISLLLILLLSIFNNSIFATSYNEVDGYENSNIYINEIVEEENLPIQDEEQEELSTDDLLKYIKNSSDTTNVILLIIFIFIFLIYILKIK